MTDATQDLMDKLRALKLKLHSLLEITNNLHHNFSFDKISNTLNYILKEQLELEKFLLLYYDQKWDVLTKNGFKIRFDVDNIIEKLQRFDKPTLIASSSDEVLSNFDMLIPVQHEKEVIAYLLLSRLKEEELPNEGDSFSNLNFIQTIINIVIVAIQNRKLMRMEVAQESLKKELEVASILQNMLFPYDLPSNMRMDISAKHMQIQQIGGDYYDFIPLKKHVYAICIADVSGKGISAALLMSNFQASVRALFRYRNPDLEFVVNELNNIVMKSSKGEKFITFFIAIFNEQTRELTYVNAGHNFPILTDGKNVELLQEGTTGLGMFEELPFLNIGHKKIPNNTTLILYTDGVVELPDEKGDFFELEHLISLIHNFYPLKMEDINNLIFSKLNEWKGNGSLVDDTAIFSCRFF